MKAVAIKKGQMREQAPAFQQMGTLRCDGCGEEFVVFHDPTLMDKKAAERRARWLEKVLAEETRTPAEARRSHPTAGPAPTGNLSEIGWLRQ
jgi:hypothetical protein